MAVWQAFIRDRYLTVRLVFFLCAMAVPCAAHMMSMSSGEAKLSGARLDYTLSMPLFEIAHTRNPEDVLLQHIQFGSARMLTHECHSEPARDSYVCHATYAYAVQPQVLEVSCTLYEVTVPNHIHLLRAAREGTSNRAVFDSAFTRATVRFRPPTALEVATGEIGKGVAFVMSSPILIFLLATLPLASASRTSAAAMSLAFLLGELAGTRLPWLIAPRLVECAAALGVAYLSVEILFLPSSLVRIAVAAGLGLAPGFALAQFASQSESGLGFTFVGSSLAVATVVGAVSFVALRFPVIRRPGAAIALVTGLGWFGIVLSR